MNRIKEVLEKKGIEELRPASAVLDRLGIKFRTWNMWLDNEKDPDMDQLPILAEFLECEIVDLIKINSKDHVS